MRAEHWGDLAERGVVATTKHMDSRSRNKTHLCGSGEKRLPRNAMHVCVCLCMSDGVDCIEAQNTVYAISMLSENSKMRSE